MSDLLELTGLMAMLLGSAIGASWLVTSAVVRRRAPLDVPVDATVRLKASQGLYRTRVLALERSGLRLAAPLVRDAYVPLRVGEPVVVEATLPDGVLRFRSQIAERGQADRTFLVPVPRDAYREDRRAEPRRVDWNGREAALDGSPCSILDISGGGARIQCRRTLGRGERVRLDVPGLPQPVYGYVLEIMPGDIVRMRFESRVLLPV